MWYKAELYKLYKEDRDRYFLNESYKLFYILPVNFDYKTLLKDSYNQNSENIRLELK